MKIYLTRDNAGLIQLWKNKPEKLNSKIGPIYGHPSTGELGIEVNSVFSEVITKPGCYGYEIEF